MTVYLQPGDFLKITIIVALNMTIHWIIASILCTMVTEKSWERRQFIFTEGLQYTIMSDALLYGGLKAILCSKVTSSHLQIYAFTVSFTYQRFFCVVFDAPGIVLGSAGN